MTIFRPVLPGRTVQFQDESHPSQAGSNVSFPLVQQPSSDPPYLHEFDQQRAAFRLRKPRLRVDDISISVERPVIEQAFVVQSTDWGFVETGAHVTPQPEDGRTLELAEGVADVATAQSVPTETSKYCDPGSEDL
jgi:hypothetical protein